MYIVLVFQYVPAAQTMQSHPKPDTRRISAVIPTDLGPRMDATYVINQSECCHCQSECCHYQGACCHCQNECCHCQSACCHYQSPCCHCQQRMLSPRVSESHVRTILLIYCGNYYISRPYLYTSELQFPLRWHASTSCNASKKM